MVNTQKQEEQYLEQVYGELLLAKERYLAQMQATNETAQQTLAGVNSEVSLNFDSYLDNLDTFSMIEMKNKEIDQLNFKNDQAQQELAKIERLLKEPYFGKVTVQFPEESAEDNFYIGINGFKNEADINRVYDWRSPIAELFYNNENGPSHYTVANQPITVDILGRRQFLIQQNQLLHFFDTTVSIQDDVLLEALETEDSAYMKDITATIQAEQNRIIRDVTSPVILVNGIAGSGKTSTVMQRIAYLLYLYRRNLTSENVLLLSPNKAFVDYISKVLPTLGEKNPMNVTLPQLLAIDAQQQPIESEPAYFDRISQPATVQDQVIRSKEFVQFLAQSEAAVQIDGSFFKDINFKKKPLLTKELIYQQFSQTPASQTLHDRLQATKNRLLSLWEQKLLKEARSERIQDQLLELSEPSQQKYFDRLLTEQDEQHLPELAYQLLNQRYARVKNAINSFKWFDQTQLLLTLFQTFTGEKYVLNDITTIDELVIRELISYHFINRKIDRSKKFVLIDEVQDYTYAQLALLRLRYPNAEFTLVGDENQAIFHSHIVFDQIAELFTSHNQLVKRYEILNSYRSSGEITRLFAPLAKNSQQLQIAAIRSDGLPPSFYQYRSLTEYRKLTQEITASLDEPLVILTKTQQEANDLEVTLQDVDCQILPISAAKGLEFDHVLVHDVSTDNYHTDLDRRLLYTSISRAMKTIYLSYSGQLSAFLHS